MAPWPKLHLLELLSILFVSAQFLHVAILAFSCGLGGRTLNALYQAPSFSLFLVESKFDTDRSPVEKRVSVVRAQDLFVLSCTTGHSGFESRGGRGGGEIPASYWPLANYMGTFMSLLDYVS